MKWFTRKKEENKIPIVKELLQIKTVEEKIDVKKQEFRENREVRKSRGCGCNR